jgi:hypothetical protein
VAHPEFESKARLFRVLRKPKMFVVGEKYIVNLELENVGQNDFPGGLIRIRLTPSHGMQRVEGEYWLDPIPKGKKVYITKFESEVLGPGFTFFTCEIKDLNGNPAVTLNGNRQPRKFGDSCGSFFAHTKTDVNQYHMLIVSMTALVLLVVFGLLQLILK